MSIPRKGYRGFESLRLRHCHFPSLSRRLGACSPPGEQISRKRLADAIDWKISFPSGCLKAYALSNRARDPQSTLHPCEIWRLISCFSVDQTLLKLIFIRAQFQACWLPLRSFMKKIGRRQWVGLPQRGDGNTIRPFACHRAMPDGALRLDLVLAYLGRNGGPGRCIP